MIGQCHIPGCHEDAMLNRYFCATHDQKWMASRERERALAIDEAQHTMTMLSDFVRRIALEEKP